MKYPNLFSPLKVGNTVFRNRIFSSPQGFYNVASDCLPNADEAAFYERKAMGGFASVCVGDCIVDIDTGRHYPFLCDMKNPDTLPGLSVVASAISRHGAVASAELSHAGMYAQDSFSRTGKLFGPIAMDGKYGPVQEMTEDMILSIIDDYGKAAAWAKRCGFGMVTIHGGHGWLLSQFYSPKINNRKDQWGGSLENRLRLPLAVVASVRRAVGSKFPIEFRMSTAECHENGYGIEDGIELAKALDGKVDIIHVSAGHHEVPSAMVITHPSMFLEDACNAKYAAAIKPYVKTPVATVGAFTTPDKMEEVLAAGQADIIEVARQSLADPDFPIKARLGRSDEIRRCIRCNTCFGCGGEHRVFECAINPEIGHEQQYRAASVLTNKKKCVLVVGGGVGGMEAALTSARAGHAVTLCEKSPRLGGALRCEEKVPFKQNMIAYLDQQAMLLQRAGVKIQLGTEITEQLAKDFAADVIIAALGARPQIPSIAGIDLPHVYGAEKIYCSPELVHGNIAIIGGGLVGIELAIFLSLRKCNVSIFEAADRLSVHEYSMHSLALQVQIKERGIKIHLSSQIKQITEGGLLVSSGGVCRRENADFVIYAVGQSPLQDEAFSLSHAAPEFYALGDCIAPKNIQAATSSAHTIALDIGRM